MMKNLREGGRKGEGKRERDGGRGREGEGKKERRREKGGGRGREKKQNLQNRRGYTHQTWCTCTPYGPHD